MRRSTILLAALLAPVAFADDKGLDSYAAGLQQMTAGKYGDAVASFEQALQGDDEDANRHLGLAIALMFNGQGNAAGPHLERARRLEPKHQAVPLWTYFYLWTCAPRGRSIPEVPRRSTEPYAKTLIDATTTCSGMRERNQPALAEQAWKQAEECAATWAWRELARPDLIQAQAAGLDGMYARQEYARCVAIADRLLEASPNDVRLLGIRAGSRLALGDLRGARLDYTRALTLAPTLPGLTLGRAVAAARTGGLRTAEADLAIALQLDPKVSEAWKAEAQKAIVAARARVPAETPEQLLAMMKGVAGDQLTAAADKLVRADAAARLVGDEAFTEELALLQHAVDADPGSVAKAVALAAFCIRPAVEVPARLSTDGKKTRVRVGSPDLERAQRILDAAEKVAPLDKGLLTQRALWFRAVKQPQEMIRVVEQALGLGALGYDLAKMYLDYYQELAAALENEAAGLRLPTVTYEDRADGSRWRVTTPPSAAAVARAEELEAQAKEMRRKSVVPLQKLAEADASGIWGKLAQAEFLRIVGSYDDAVKSAESALAIDPWHLETLEYLVDLCPKVGMGEKAWQYADLIDNLAAPSATRTIVPAFGQLAQTRYKGALETLDAGERKDPASPTVAALRAIVLASANRSAEAETAFRLAAAITGASLSLHYAAADAPVQAEDAGLTLALDVAWSRMHGQADAAEAWNRLDSLLRLAGRVPQWQWDKEIAAAALPTVYTHADDKRRTGMTVRELIVEAQMSGAGLLESLDRLEDAARLLVACKSVTQGTPLRPPVDSAAFPIIKKLGEERAARIFPPEMMEGYHVMQRFGTPKPGRRGTKTTGIDPENRKQWIEARLKEIAEDLEQLGPSQTYTAMRKRQELEDEKTQLEAELEKLR